MKFEIDPVSYMKQVFEDPISFSNGKKTLRKSLLGLSKQDLIFLENQIRKNIKNIERYNELLSILHEEDAYNNFSRYQRGCRSKDLIAFIENECRRGKDTTSQDFITREFSAFNFKEGDWEKFESKVLKMTTDYIQNLSMAKSCTALAEMTLAEYKKMPENELKSLCFQSEKKSKLIETRKAKINSEKQFTGKSFLEASQQKSKSKEYEEYLARMRNQEARYV